MYIFPTFAGSLPEAGMYATAFIITGLPASGVEVISTGDVYFCYAVATTGSAGAFPSADMVK